MTLREQSWDEWRIIARGLLKEGVPPEYIQWKSNQENGFDFTFDSEQEIPKKIFNNPTAPKEFIDIAKRVAYHRDPDRWALLYRIIWSLQTQPHTLNDPLNPDILNFNLYLKAVNFDAHKLKAYVRFRKHQISGKTVYRAWHKSEHRVLRLTAPFFKRRFSTLHWTIATPDETVEWNGMNLQFSEGIKENPGWEDELDDMWLTYYGSTFNPARLKIKAMMKEMPVKYWSTMPETKLIPSLVSDAFSRMNEMIAQNDKKEIETASIKNLKELDAHVAKCQKCDWIVDCTQAVSGTGDKKANLMLVGEQPGDSEDLSGTPFTGPSGEVLKQALTSAKISQSSIYVTNAVKHFKHRLQEKRRLHERPNRKDIANCNPWLKKEIDLIKPKVIVCLGATAAQSVLGRKVLLKDEIGKWHILGKNISVLTTIHPAAILRSKDKNRRENLLKTLVRDLEKIGSFYINDLDPTFITDSSPTA